MCVFGGQTIVIMVIDEKKKKAWKKEEGLWFLKSMWRIARWKLVIGFPFFVCFLLFLGLWLGLQSLLKRGKTQVELEEIVPGQLWQMAYDEGAHNSTVVKGKDGSLLLLQAPPCTPEVKDCLHSLGGPIKYVMAPDAGHNKHHLAWDDVGATLLAPLQDAQMMEKHGVASELKHRLVCFDRDEEFSNIARNYFLTFVPLDAETTAWQAYEFHFRFSVGDVKRHVAVCPCPFTNPAPDKVPIFFYPLCTPGPRAVLYSTIVYADAPKLAQAWKHLCASSPDVIIFQHGVAQKGPGPCLISANPFERTFNVMPK